MPTPPDRPRPPTGGHDRASSSDRRVLIVGSVTIVALLIVGIGGAALFTGSACEDIGADPIPAGFAGSSFDDVRDDLLADADPAGRADLEETLAELEGRLGQVVGVADADGARTLAALDDGRVLARGQRTRVIASTGDEVETAAAFTAPGRVVGSGDGLFVLALVNELTGQVDAFSPLDPDLEPGTCLDTAVVGEPFAFHLDAGSGELLLFRVEEDSADPVLELRDGVVGRRWAVGVDLPTASPGLLAERMSARLGDGRVLMARRITPGEPEPAVVAFDRSTGETRWELPAEAVLTRFGDGQPLWIEPQAAGGGLSLVSVWRGEGGLGDREALGLLAIDDEGGVRWSADLEAGDRIVTDVAVGADAVVAAIETDGRVRVLGLQPDDGRQIAAFDPVPGEHGVLELRDDGTFVLVAVGGTVGVLSADATDLRHVETVVAARDVAAVEGRTMVLLDVPGGGRIVVTFES